MRRYVVSLCVLLCSTNYTEMCPEMTKSENLDCYSNYADRITCIWQKGSHSGNGPFFLTFEDKNNYEDEVYRNCNLVSGTYGENFNCDITDLVIDDTDRYDIAVNDLSSAEILATIEEFQPCCNIKLDPPSDLSYNVTGAAYNITWRVNSRFIEITGIHCELQLKTEASRPSITKNIYDRSVEIMTSEFDEGSNYIQIRCRTENQESYKSRWSEWSSELKIQISEERTEGQAGQKQDIIHIITVVTLLTMTLILLILALRSNLFIRINVSFLKKIPTAADFFHPLYQIHDGNFQDWTKYPNKCKENKKGEQHSVPRDIDLYSTTVLYVQKEAVSPVKLESPFSEEDVSLTPDPCNFMSCSDPLGEKETFLNGIYPASLSVLPRFSDDNINEDVVCGLDCPTDYVSYDENYIANSQEIDEELSLS